MSGSPNRPSHAKRPVLIVGAAILVIAVGAASAWLTRPPETAPPRISKAEKARLAAVRAATPAAAPAPAAAPVVIPQSEAPPEPTSTDFARAGTPPPPTPAPPTETQAVPAAPIDWTAMAIDELRAKANADEIPAMEELARRLVQGTGVPKDQQAGAGWLLRAAQHGSAQSAFNVGVMYERGFVVERDSSKAIEWYRKAVDANLPMAKHNLALLLRDGKGAPRNGKEAVELLRSASRQGMAASMFSLGDIYERGDAAPKDPAMALAWFAITAEFERQTNRSSGESALAKTATQRAQALQRILLPGELERAQQFGQSEFKQIVEALQPPKPPAAPAAPAPAGAAAPEMPPADSDPPGWPKSAVEQVRVIQQALVDLKYLRDKPDGAIGPLTRAAIRTFQRSIMMRETGEPTKEVFAALKETIARRDAVASTPPKPEPPTAEAKAEPKPEAKVEPPKAEPAKPPAATAAIDIGKPEPSPAPPTSADIARAASTAEAAKVEAAKVEPPKPDLPKPPMPAIETAKPAPPQVAAAAEPTKVETAKTEPAKPEAPKPAAVATLNIGKPEPPPAPPTSADITRAMPKPEPPKPDPNAWPATTADQVKAIQGLLRDLKFLRDEPDGLAGPATREAIREYERTVGLAQTGEPSKALFDSLKEMRDLTAPKSN